MGRHDVKSTPDRGGNNRRRQHRRDVRRRKRRGGPSPIMLALIGLLVVLAVVLAVVLINRSKDSAPPAAPPTPAVTTETPAPTADPADTLSPDNTAGDFPAPTDTLEPTPDPTPEPTPTPVFSETPHAVDGTRPESQGIDVALNVDDQDVSSYHRPVSFSFGQGSDYTQLEGIITFRGDNWRQGATYGTANVVEKEFERQWTVETGSMQKSYGTGYWSGSGWTGQPLVVKWPDEIKQIMNINEEKKAKDGLVEVIYATLDGKVYFLDLEDGKETRKPINVGVPFKGAGALDPRGYPLLYLGAGDAGKGSMVQAFFVYSLIDGERLYFFGKYRDPFAKRKWHAYDSSALVDAATDTLIAPGENGILYTVKLNTDFNLEAGTISVNPSEMVKLRYTTERSRKGERNTTYLVGMEDSAVMWGKYMYIADNCGTFLCIDTDTMDIIWAQDVVDDTNTTPILEEENGHPYLYISTSLKWTADRNNRGVIPIWKVDGITGEKIWQRDYNCVTVKDVSGGVQSTGLIGKNDVSHLVFYTVARTPNTNTGKLVALDKATGEEIWVHDMKKYTWSSPVAVNDESGKTYLVVGDSGGNLTLFDALTGEVLFSADVGSNIEASPVIYNDMIVVGTRGRKIFGIKIK